MKYIKMFGLLAVAAGAMMAFAGSASAIETSTLTSPEGTYYTGELKAETEGHAVLINTSMGTRIECQGTVLGVIGSEHGMEAGAIHPTFNGCTNGWHVTTVAGGTLTATDNGNGTADLYSSGATITTTRLMVVCNYLTNNTTVGTLTDGANTGTGMATIHINGAIPIHTGSSGLCGTAKAHWNSSYTVTSPSNLYLD